MKKIISLVLTLSLVCGIIGTLSAPIIVKAAPVSAIQSIRDSYGLVWNDEFDGTSLNTDKWRYDGHLTTRNGEAQVYADGDADGNVWVKDGCLVIEGRREDRTVITKSGTEKTYHFTSGEVSTSDTFGMTYGIIEARLKIPASLSLWPAFWSCGVDRSTGGRTNWPKSGEIDIMENFAKDNSHTASTLHYQPVGYTGTSKTATGCGGYSSPTMSTEFHTYGMYWTPEKIIMFVDDFIIGYADITDHDRFFAFHDYKQFFILNVAVGNAGGVDIEDSFVADRMYVDYVRAYQPKDGVYDQLNITEPEKCAEFSGTATVTKNTTGLSVSGQGLNNYGRYTQPSVSAGSYDVYLQNKCYNQNSFYQTRINGVKLGSPFSPTATENRGFNYIGKMKLQTDSDLNISFSVTEKGENSSSNLLYLSIDKLLFVKSDDSGATEIPYQNLTDKTPKTVEISSYSDWNDKIVTVFENDTIKLTGDITYSISPGGDFWKPTNNNITLDLNGHTISDGYYKIVEAAGSVAALNYSGFVKSRVIAIPADTEFTVKNGTLSCFSNIVNGDTSCVMSVGTSSGAVSKAHCTGVTMINVVRDVNGDRTAVIRFRNSESDFTNCNFYTTYHYGYAGNTSDAGAVFMTNKFSSHNRFIGCRFETNSTAISLSGTDNNITLEQCYINQQKNTCISSSAVDSTVSITDLSATSASNGTVIKQTGANSVCNVSRSSDSIKIGADSYKTQISGSTDGIYVKTGTLNISDADILAGQYALHAYSGGIINLYGGNIMSTNKLTTTAARLYAPVGVEDGGCVNIYGGTIGAAEGCVNQACIYTAAATAQVNIYGGSFIAQAQLAISPGGGKITSPVTSKDCYTFEYPDCIKAVTAYSDELLTQAVTDNLCYQPRLYFKTAVALGDVNADGAINGKDILQLRRHLVGFPAIILLSAADATADGVINAKDLLLIMLYYAGYSVKI